jgi:putative nucleotidyltransferase with HDIG domain
LITASGFVAAGWFYCSLLGYSTVIPLLLVFFVFYLKLVGKNQPSLFLQLGLLLTLIVFVTDLITRYTTIPLYYIPIASIGMLTMLLYNSFQLTLLMSSASSIIVSMILDGGFVMMFTFLFGSLVGAYTVKEARTRSRLINAGLLVSVMNLIAILLFKPFPFEFIFTEEFLAQYFYPLLGNGLISAFIVAATLKIFEYLFGALTNFSLLELSDSNHPLLKRLAIEAPGSYHHSLVVSNLAESAADSIGAHALLVRVGAYYHDVGKLTQPEYFTENQLMGVNKHDVIEPTVSRLVILNHVKEGVELAKKYRINPAIIDFIPQHHGTGLIHYFYQKSLEAAEEGEEILEENFRYPGPKPQSRETAIVLLADSAEGATRALSEPSPTAIEETVKKVINNKFIDGQLDECPLTLKEIEKISSTFTRVLTAMYHSRVKYPQKKNGAPRKE